LDSILTEFWAIENAGKNLFISESIIRTKWWKEGRNLEIFIEAVRIIENQPTLNTNPLIGPFV
jgi:hypothetical protein